MKCRCNSEIHPVRIELGLKTCIKCSTAKQYSCVPIINGKTGNTIQVVSAEQAQTIRKSLRTKNKIF